MNKEFISAIEQIEKSKGISKDIIFEAIESALISAYKKNYGSNQNVRVDIDGETGDIRVYTVMDIVEEIEDESTQITLEEALEIDPNFELGDEVFYQVTTEEFGRIAAQTAKQVVVQRIREAERGIIFDDYVEKQGEVVTGTIQRKSGDTIFVNMGRTEGILSAKEQVPGERFEVNDRIKVYIMDVKKTTKGPQVFLSRSHPGLVKRLFELEVPEIEDGVVEIKSIAREAGSRTKMAVYTEDENVDPVGACVGSRGSRVQNIVDELFNEKIDIITWSEEPGTLISNVLSPAKVEEVMIEDEEKVATVIVPDYQLSLAIGKSGQNVRLAAKLCGWKIDIKSHTQYYGDDEENDEEYEDNEEISEDTYESASEEEISEAQEEMTEADSETEPDNEEGKTQAETEEAAEEETQAETEEAAEEETPQAETEEAAEEETQAETEEAKEKADEE
ncbi:MAG: transcription termination factor NusA [Eubacteriales bacterium]|jgi:N utilization substance protein A|nr:transcription termination factor NusA [Eubacteriales bacterium]